MQLRKTLISVAVATAVAVTPMQVAATGIPVFDAAAVVNLIQQISYWQQQISAMSNQLQQLQQTYNAMTGPRGMQNVLGMTNKARNYLPPDYAEIVKVVSDASTDYSGIAGQVQAAIAANSVLSSVEMNRLTPAQRDIVETGRRSAAMLTTLSQSAYQNTSQRFQQIQTLIDTIAAAGDTKAIAELQTRVSAEQAMLTNEQTKLQTLLQIAQADQLVQQQTTAERRIAAHGDFGTRFTPTFP